MTTGDSAGSADFAGSAPAGSSGVPAIAMRGVTKRFPARGAKGERRRRPWRRGPTATRDGGERGEGERSTADGVVAVDDLHLEVPAGICLGLLGPNGAGKSTTMRMLTAQAHPDEGTIEVLGFRVPEEAKQARAAMGVVPQQDNLDEELTARENLDVFAHLYRVPRRERREAVDAALALAQLTDRQHTEVSRLSGGMRRRLLIARGLVHRPALVLLDEPTVGLDPQIRAQLWTLIDGLRARGTTVLMSTHYIEEAERLADDCALMSRGRVVARGAPSKLIAEHAGEYAVEHYGPPERLAEIERVAADAGLPTRRTGPSVSVLRAETISPSVADRIGDGGVRRVANLEDVFVVLTGESVE